MTQQQSTASIVLCLLVMVFMVHWSCTQAESSLVAQSSSANWETDTIPTSQSKSSLSTNLNDISDRLYRIIYKRLADTTASVDPYGGK